MTSSTLSIALAGRVAPLAGATRGTGRGIADGSTPDGGRDDRDNLR